MRLLLVTLLALALVPLAAAQGNNSTDPDLNDSDFDDSVPAGDDSYLDDGTTPPANDSSEADPTLSESDLDTSVPPPDDSYLDDAAPAGGDTPQSGTQPTDGDAPETNARTPGFGVVAVALAGAIAAITARRR